MSPRQRNNYTRHTIHRQRSTVYISISAVPSVSIYGQGNAGLVWWYHLWQLDSVSFNVRIICCFTGWMVGYRELRHLQRQHLSLDAFATFSKQTKHVVISFISTKKYGPIKWSSKDIHFSSTVYSIPPVWCEQKRKLWFSFCTIEFLIQIHLMAGLVETGSSVFVSIKKNTDKLVQCTRRWIRILVSQLIPYSSYN